MRVSQGHLSLFNTFGDFLKFLRRRAQLTQRDLSIAVGYSESQISRLESNQRAPDRSSLLALFVPALHIEREKELVDRLLELAAANRSRPSATEDDGSQAIKRRVHLPAQLTSFIGREADIENVCQILRDPETRLLTLTGEGGCGKTRLALQAASRMNDEFQDGVWLVELGPLADPALILNAALSALNVIARIDRTPVSVLADFLAPKELLLILDNCEHLIEAAARMAAELLRICPQLTILATSREKLEVPGETVFRILPLSLPPAQRGSVLSRDQIEPYEAIQLFCTRARNALHSFELTDQNASAVARICQRLDGIPLALELAATWASTLSIDQIAARLAFDFDLLAGGNRYSLPQHQTLRATLDWSYQLLAESERTLLRRMSIFAGGFSLEAIEEVTGGFVEPGWRAPKEHLLTLLSRLVNKSLVFVERDEARQVRYRLLETVRSYLQEKVLEAGETDWLHRQHLEYFCKLAERSEAELKTSRQIEWMGRLIQERDNFRSALHYCLAHRLAADGLRLAGALGFFWWMRGFDSETLMWLEGALELAKLDSGLENRLPQAKVLLYLGVLYYSSGVHEPGDHFRAWQEGLRVARACEDDMYAGVALCFLGVYHGDRNHYPDAHSSFEESLQHLQRVEEDWWIAETLH